MFEGEIRVVVLDSGRLRLLRRIRQCTAALPDALRLSGLQNTFSPAPVGRIRRHAASGNVPPRCLMRCAYQAYKIRSARPL